MVVLVLGPSEWEFKETGVILFSAFELDAHTVFERSAWGKGEPPFLLWERGSLV
jgi:hypothetical protein